jgi:hypothetical protein
MEYFVYLMLFVVGVLGGVKKLAPPATALITPPRTPTTNSIRYTKYSIKEPQ